MFNTNEIDDSFEKLQQANTDYQNAVQPLSQIVNELEQVLEKLEKQQNI